MPSIKAVRKQKRQAMAESRKKAVESRKNRDDKRWKRVLAKMSDEKRKQYHGVGNTAKNSRVRGATRASLRPRTGRKADNVSVEATIHLAKLLKKKTFHKRAPLAIKRIKTFVAKLMKTKDNRIDSSLNTYIWHKGVKGVPGRVRVRVDRHSETPEGSKRKHFYTIISNVPVASFKGLTTKSVEQ
ncbi:large subunit ribosomal protein L31e [Strigomonas culicis]|uniref:Large subunit ribosomal protein L31e n=1 Tax=Strigomonas culicis TaxID=28005 RepID=S9W5U3_9TRYP|nr:large subunit ribosomal protein L31e [Strigomonas culicis]EPY25107.1 large subunit ribosomal protein L31e [Strigomonas culicis]EPY31275.1 large subunit ribosomal protein L31e [Strigomonas culicis]EPY32268.1 large subunit ribosomal protein L31e [Strigomonas culicis]|eukprot:EPY22638.1 large subunit ribosomal protein L31e [Strigomonas culicis]